VARTTLLGTLLTRSAHDTSSRRSAVVNPVTTTGCRSGDEEAGMLALSRTGPCGAFSPMIPSPL
jgi:hypothetical protein